MSENPFSVHGIHHITAISSDPQQTYDFYSKILGLRLVKKTVNQDDTQTYHLFFGDKTGSPGMDLTFFTFQPAYQGKRGVGQVTRISLAVPESSLQFWQDRFTTLNIKNDGIAERFGQKTLQFYDQDDQRLELVGVPEELLNQDDKNVWMTTEVSSTVAIRYFYAATLCVSHLALIEPALSFLGYQKKQDSEKKEHLYQLGEQQRAAFLIVEEQPELADGVNTAGTVHHIAFAVKNEETELELRKGIFNLGMFPTQVIDRFYFRSVYFRTLAGILFELATEEPGFTADEDESTLGAKLALPPFLESQRKTIEENLSPIKQN